MVSKNKLLAIFGPILLGVISIILVYTVLISTGVIVAKEYTLVFEAVDASKIYDGEALTLSDYRIVSGSEYLTKYNHYEVVNYKGTQIDAGESEGTLDVSIFDKNGADVTDKYNIVITPATLTVEPRSISVETFSYSKMYDGESIDVNSPSLNGYNWYSIKNEDLINNETATYTVTGHVDNIGKTYIEVVPSIYDKNGNPVNSNNYTINYIGDRGYIEITKRFINVDTKSQSIYYDGKTHYFSDYDMLRSYNSVNLLSGDRIVSVSLNSKRELKDYTEGGYTLNEGDFDVVVVDQSGNDRSEIYGVNPSSDFGTFTINRINLNVITYDETKPYDGLKLETSNYRIENDTQVPESEKIEFVSKASLTQVGEIENKLEIKVTDNSNKDTSANYLITYASTGNLTIVPREITIKTNSLSKEYNGEAIIGKEVLDEDDNAYSIVSGSVADNETLKVTMSATITDCGEVTNELTEVIVLDKLNNDVTSNYKIIKNEGTLEITKIEVTLFTEGESFNYDGYKHSNKNFNFNNFPTDCTYEIYDWPEITDAKFDSLTGEAIATKNTPSIYIYSKDGKIIYDSNESDNGNIKLTISAGDLYINPITLTITTQSKTKTYDGLELKKDYAEISGKRAEDTISYVWPSLTDVLRDEDGNVISKENKPEVTITDSTGKDVTKNYYIKYNLGELRIDPIEIVVDTYDKTKEYDGSPMVITDSDYSITTSNLVNGDTIGYVKTITDFKDVLRDKNKNVISKENKIEIFIETTEGKDNTKNYNINYRAIGNLTINPFELTIETESAELSYDGLEHKYESYTVSSTDPLKEIPSKLGYQVSGFKGYTNCNIASGAEKAYDNTCNFVLYFIDSNEVISENNYTLTKNYGSILIHRIIIDVETMSFTKEYDGTPFIKGDDLDSDWFSVTGIHDYLNNPLSLPSYYSIKFKAQATKVLNRVDYTPSPIDNELTLKILRNSIELDDTTSLNYKFNYTYGSLTITQVDLVVETALTRVEAEYTIEKTYDGLYLVDNTVVISEPYLSKLNNLNITYSVTKYTSVKDCKIVGGQASKITNDITLLLENASGTNVTKNFNITYNTGYFLIKPIAIVLTTDEYLDNAGATISKTYDGTPLSSQTLKPETVQDENKLLSVNATLIKNSATTITDVQWTKENVSVKTINNVIEYEIQDENGNDITANFSVTEHFGSLRIDPIEITVYTEKTRVADNYTLSKYYDGEPLSDNKIYMTAYDIAKITQLGATYNEYANSPSIIEPQKVSNSFTIEIMSSSMINITSNFKVTYNTGYLEIKERDIELTSASTTFSYDNTTHYDDSYTITRGASILNEYDYTITVLTHTSITDAGTVDNVLTYSIEIKDDDGEDITDNFSIGYKNGKLTVNKIKVYIEIDSKEKSFDNTVLTISDNEWDYYTETDRLKIENFGFTMSLDLIGERLLAGETTVSYEPTILDSSSNDKTDNFEIITKSTPKLTINPFKVDIKTKSKTKIYDGTVLTCNEYEYITTLPSGFTYNNTFTGSITNVGETDNSITYEILDFNSVNVDTSYNGCFTFNVTFGTLKVTPYVTGTGNLLDNSVNPDNSVTQFTFTSTKKGVVYFRDRSYGDYNGTGFDYISEYESTNPSYANISPLYLTSKVLSEKGYNKYADLTITINENLPYFTTYYDLAQYQVNNDVHIYNPNNNYEYLLEFYKYKYNLDSYTIQDSLYNAFELEYRSYVDSTYLTIDNNLKNKLLTLLTNEGIDSDDPKIIYLISEYVKNNYTYNSGNINGKDTATDLIDFFLSVKTGKCSDFSALAVMLYRACSIPARYVTGFIYNVNESEIGSTINVTQNYAHAWVEVYIDSIGWIVAEVTDGNPSTISDGDTSDYLPNDVSIVSRTANTITIKAESGVMYSFDNTNFYTIINNKLYKSTDQTTFSLISSGSDSLAKVSDNGDLTFLKVNSSTNFSKNSEYTLYSRFTDDYITANPEKLSDIKNEKIKTLKYDASDIASLFGDSTVTLTGVSNNEAATGTNVNVTVNNNGMYEVKLKSNINSTLELIDSIENLTIDLNNHSINGTTATSAEGSGNDGIIINHDSLYDGAGLNLYIIDSSLLKGGTINGSDAYSASGMNGGNGINVSDSANVNSISIDNGVRVNGGDGADGSSTNINGGAGGTGITGDADIDLINANITGGDGGDGYNTGNGGAGGDGIKSSSKNNNVYVSNESTVTAGNGGDGGDSSSSLDGGAGGAGGTGIKNSTVSIEEDGLIDKAKINGGDGGNGGSSSGGNGGAGGTGGDGITNDGELDGGVIKAGKGGDGGDSTSGTGGDGGAGGDAISNGESGDAKATNGSGGSGGAGGAGNGEAGEAGGSNGSGSGGSSGGLGNSRNGLTADDEEVMLSIKSTKKGTIYLRDKSYDNYTGLSWTNTVGQYTSDINPLNYAYLSHSSSTTGTITIDLTSGKYNSYLTVYNVKTDLSEYNDTYVNGDYSSKYSLEYIPLETDLSEYTLTGDYLAYEEEYRTFVYNNYLNTNNLSPTLKTYLNEIITDNGFDKSSSTIIDDVKNYVKTAATYSTTYDYEGATDAVYAFLHDYKVGECNKFASSATLLYRMLGIPARYTEGVIATISNTTTYTDVKSKNRHAWCEVYIDGHGWVAVDATGSSTTESVPEVQNNSSKMRVSIYPKQQEYKYGTTYTVSDAIQGFSTYTKLGYQITGTVSGISNTLGVHMLSIDNYQITKDGEDVTDEFIVTCYTSTLKIYYDEITIVTKSATKEYDGTPLTANELESYDASKLMSNHHVDSSKLVCTGTITEPGTIRNDIDLENLILDEYGNDVTSYYKIDKNNLGSLIVTKRQIEIEADSMYVEYDDLTDEEIVCHEYTITSGSLLTGHYVDSITFSSESYLSTEQTECENIITSIVIKDSKGVDVTDKYYDIVFQNGYLGIE